MPTTIGVITIGIRIKTLIIEMRSKDLIIKKAIAVPRANSTGTATPTKINVS
ncbi:unnamed protein product, partial [marine sediment metagenome]